MAPLFALPSSWQSRGFPCLPLYRPGSRGQRSKRPGRRNWCARRRGALWALALAAAFLFLAPHVLFWHSFGDQPQGMLLQTEINPSWRFDLSHVIVSLSTTEDRLSRELPLTLRSLLRQTLRPLEIRVYLPLSLRGKFLADPTSSAVGLNQSSAQGSGIQAILGGAHETAALPAELQHPLVKVWFANDLGSSTKFLPVLHDLTSSACLAASGYEGSALHTPRGSLNLRFFAETGADRFGDEGGESGEEVAARILRTPIVVVDDDHYYMPSLLETLVRGSWGLPPCAAVGLRGWRVRKDLQWGVQSDKEYSFHVVEGFRISRPYRVGVLTANEGYLVRPAFLVHDSLCSIDVAASETPSGSGNDDGSSRVQPLRHNASRPTVRQEACSGVPLVSGFFHRHSWSHSASAPVQSLGSGPTRFADDICMSGSLAASHVARYVLPAPSSNIDITRAHTLESRMGKKRVTRGAANVATLRHFRNVWEQDLWYEFGGVHGPELTTNRLWRAVRYRHLQLCLAWDYLASWVMRCMIQSRRPSMQAVK